MHFPLLFSTLAAVCLLTGVAQGLSVPISTDSQESRPVKRSLCKCNAAFFEHILPDDAALEKVEVVPAGGTVGEGASDLPYPDQPTNLPPLCAVIVNVTSSPSSFYRFGLLLPAEWNERFLAVGNGGFAGGINWLSAVSLRVIVSTGGA